MAGLLRVAVVLGITTSSLSAQAPTGTIAGRITDHVYEQLPGVTLRLSGGDTSRKTQTDESGRFAFADLTPGTYRVVAELQGFRPSSGDITISTQAPRAFLSWTMDIGCLTDVLIVIPPPTTPLDSSMRWVRARIMNHVGPTTLSLDAYCEGDVLQEYSVEVLDSIPLRERSPARSERLFANSSDLSVGQEYIILTWRDKAIANERVLPVVNGRVVSPGIRELNGKSLAKSWATLAKWARRPSR